MSAQKNIVGWSALALVLKVALPILAQPPAPPARSDQLPSGDQAAPEAPGTLAGPAGEDATTPPPSAQVAGAAPAPAPKVNVLSTPDAAYEPPPPVTRAHRSARYHDGFFLRMALGFGPGYMDERVTVPGVLSEHYKFSGPTGMFEVLIGGSPVPGFVLGGGLVGTSMINPTVRRGSEEVQTSDTELQIAQIVVFTQVYPDPRAGFLLQGYVGYGSPSIRVGDETFDVSTDGIAVGGGVGYDFWVADQWSLGPFLGLTYASMSGNGSGVEIKEEFFSPILAFGVTYH